MPYTPSRPKGLSKHGLPWARDEEEVLRKMISEGASLSAIAQTLERSAVAIGSKAAALRRKLAPDMTGTKRTSEMPKHEQTKTAKPQTAAPQNQDRSPARQKDQQRTSQKPKDDLPGADGPLSASATDDTYD